MESRTLVCDRCARGSKFVIAVESAIVQTRTHGTFRIDLCEEHRDSLVQDLDALNIGHVVKAIIEQALQSRPGASITRQELQRISGASRKLVIMVLDSLVNEKKVQLVGKTRDKAATWIGPKISSNGSKPPELDPLPLGAKAQRGAARHKTVEWMRMFLKQQRDVGAIELGKAAKAEGLPYSTIAFARNRLRGEKMLRVKGTKSRARYIWTGG